MMRPQVTPYDEERFGNFFLTDILAWVAENMVIDEVFNEQEIDAWLADNGYGYVEEN